MTTLLIALDEELKQDFKDYVSKNDTSMGRELRAHIKSLVSEDKTKKKIRK